MSARSQGRADAAAGKSKNPYRNITIFDSERPKDGDPNQRKYDEWNEGYADKKREMKK